MSQNRKLMDLLPKAGMVYPGVSSVHARPERDEAIYDALETKGIIKYTSNKGFVQAMADIREYIKGTFVLAMIEKIRENLDEGPTERENLHRLFGKLKQSESYASEMDKPRFILFFCCLIEARLAWKAHPVPPFPTEHHSELVRTIDEFLICVGEKSASLYSVTHLYVKLYANPLSIGSWT
ncbi:hypothetical protein F5B20DRAFT_560939 [Whalleya microplaca]|nr:hypothetical protein F5B20DRAFT_560939 [Whalleya microplaca]